MDVEVRVPPDPAGSPTSIVRKAFEDLPSSVDVGLRRVLSALAAGPLHGYAVIKEVSRLSADRVQLAAGTLYAALDRLSDEDLVEVDREETVDGRLRRYYRLTGPGASALAAEAEQMSRDARMVIRRLRGAGPAGAPGPA